MHTERVTYLTNPEQKAALEAFAKARGESVGSVLREAASRYMAEPDDMTEAEEAALDMLARELEDAVPRWNAKMDSMEQSIAHARKAIRDALARVEATK